jgi:hypothetical protein
LTPSLKRLSKAYPTWDTIGHGSDGALKVAPLATKALPATDQFHSGPASKGSHRSDNDLDELVLTSAQVFHTVEMLCGFACEGDANRFGQFTKKPPPPSL